MKTLRRAWNRLAGSFGGGRREAELAEELESHVEMLADEYRRRGMPPAEARHAALVAFGGLETTKETCRDQRGLPTLDSLRQDVLYALRGMRRNPVFTAIAVACLALGIGANTAIFSLFNAVMLRDLPVSRPEELVFFHHTGAGDMNAVRSLSSGYGQAALPYAAYEAFRDRARTLSGVFVFVSPGLEGNGLTVSVSGRSLAADGEMVTGSYFPVLGVSPVLGRAIGENDLKAGAPDVAVVSHRFWMREFGGEPSAVGSAITINGRAFTVIGVAPPAFTGLQGAIPDVWLPLRPTPALRPWGSRANLFDRRYWWCTIAGRRKPDVTLSQVLAETGYLFRQSITAGLPRVPANLPGIRTSQASPIFEMMRRRFSPLLGILTVTAALLLLVACANLATLLLARARSRQKEIGVRLAIGASRPRVFRQLLTESILLSLCGGLIGMALAYGGAPVLLGLITGGREGIPLNVSPDTSVLAFAALVSLATGVLFGVAPAFRAARMDLGAQMKDAPGSGAPRRGMARSLVAAQIALSVVLLFGAGLFVRTFRNLDGLNLGFNRENLLLFEIDPARSGYEGTAGIALHSRVLEHIRKLSGVRSATFSEFALLSGWSNSSPSGTDGGVPIPPGRSNEVHYSRVGPDFFETVGMRILLGRGIAPRDIGAGRPMAVVNETWARTFYPNENPVGHRLSLGSDRFKPEQSFEIVGVAEDARHHRIRNAPPRAAFLSYGSKWDRSRRMCFAVRTAADPLAMAGSVRAAVREIDPNLPLFHVKTQRRQVEEALGQERLLAHMSSFFGGLALLLVAIGIYGTLSYTVTRRTGEIGIRMALGARRGEVVWMILRESLLVAACGLAAGLPAALALSRFAESVLFGVGARDGLTIAATAIVLFGIVAASGFLPANRASQIDPMRALRHE